MGHAGKKGEGGAVVSCISVSIFISTAPQSLFVVRFFFRVYLECRACVATKGDLDEL